MPKESTKKKRKATTSAFDQVAHLELEDQTAEQRRHKQSVKDVTRAKAARSQTKIYGSLMETRILLQRTLQQADAYAQQQQQQDHKEDQSDDDASSDTEQHSTTTAALEEECDDLLEQLLQARRHIVPTLNKQKLDHNDSITMEQILSAEYETCQQEWKDVLNRRHQDLKLHAGLAASSKTQFRVLDSSFWQQVESTVHHEEMRQRSHNATTGGSDTEVGMFDDSKVYQRMLKDFLVIASSSSSSTGGDTATDATGYQRWKSPHPKKQVDRKASKGRKIRYVEIPKLANFTFPISKSCHSNLDGDEWFKSLFGGAGNVSTTNNSNNSAGAMLVSSGDAESD